VRQLFDEANRWTAVEDELRGMLNGVAGANLIRRQRVALVTRRPSPSECSWRATRPTPSRAARAGDQAVEELQPPQEGGPGSRNAAVSGTRYTAVTAPVTPEPQGTERPAVQQS